MQCSMCMSHIGPQAYCAYLVVTVIQTSNLFAMKLILRLWSTHTIKPYLHLQTILNDLYCLAVGIQYPYMVVIM